MKLKDIIALAIREGDVCDGYKERLNEASTLKEVMDIAMDVNGMEWLCFQSQYSYFDFRDALLHLAPSFINGKHTASYMNDKGNGYTTSLYVGDKDVKRTDVEVDSTIACFLRMSADVYIRKNNFVRIYADKDTSITLHLDKNAKCEVNVSGNGIVLIDDKSESSNVLINR